MKTILISLFAVLTAMAGTTEIPVEFEIVEGKGFCKASDCQVDEETGRENCRWQVRFDDESFEAMRTLRDEKGLNSTWFKKSPADMCEEGELPMEGEGSKAIKVMLYKMDRSVLSEQF